MQVLTPFKVMTIAKISGAYGISTSTVNNWKKRAGLDMNDFKNPQLVAEKLASSAVNRSPRLEALVAPKNQLHIAFRLAAAGVTQSK